MSSAHDKRRIRFLPELIILVVITIAFIARIAAADDWPAYQHDNEHTGRSSASINPLSLAPAWQAADGYSVPLVVGSSVYSMNTRSGVHFTQFDLATGAHRWDQSQTVQTPSAMSYA